jgi:GAF domain-containing protein
MSDVTADAMDLPFGTEPDEPLRTLGELTTMLLTADTIEDVLWRVVRAARHVIPGAALVSITLREDDGTLSTPIETEYEAVELDLLQYQTGHGPCVDCADPEGPAYAFSRDLANEKAWPTFAAAAASHGYGSVLSTALLTGPQATAFTGALNIYSRERDGFDADSRDLAFLLATHASLALASMRAGQALAEAKEEALQLRKAVDSRTIIGQATGILMARRRLSADDAFEVLRHTSQNRNIKLNRLAAILAGDPGLADRL